MARPKRVNPMVSVARNYLKQHAPELKDIKLHVQCLDGPPESPRYMVTAAACTTSNCPYGVSPEQAARGKCPILECQLRNSIRLLFTRQGQLVEDMRSGIRWT